MNDEIYVCCTSCTWHEYFSRTATRQEGTEIAPCCPHCFSELRQFPSLEAFQHATTRYDDAQPGYSEMVRWGRGKSFPDFDTLQNAYRQAMAPTEGNA